MRSIYFFSDFFFKLPRTISLCLSEAGESIKLRIDAFDGHSLLRRGRLSFKALDLIAAYYQLISLEIEMSHSASLCEHW